MAPPSGRNASRSARGALLDKPAEPAGQTVLQPASLPAIFFAFLLLGAVSFGGGLSAWVYREVVLQRRWMTEDDFLAGLGLSQVLPGTNISNLTIYVGSRLRGVAGATVALLALLCIPFFSVIGLLLLYGLVADPSLIQAPLDGVAAAAVGLMVLIAWRAGRRVTRHVAGSVVLVVTFVLVGVLQWPLIPVVLCIAPLSVAAAWPRSPRL